MLQGCRGYTSVAQHLPSMQKKGPKSHPLNFKTKSLLQLGLPGPLPHHAGRASPLCHLSFPSLPPYSLKTMTRYVPHSS